MEIKAQQPRFEYVELPVKSCEELLNVKSFYSGVFGWYYTDWGEDYADTKDSGTFSGLNADPSQASPQPLAIIYVQDIEATRHDIISAGGRITKELFPFLRGRRFRISAPVGNELGIWSDK